ncbi:hypothetical protein AWJ20_4930 [Sugiyamaella lignohabitans]|uniref:Peptidase S33 tripeptidyl aminopeptidase-like C-terminal domain-containing protein n=1 Tax=Sugiyamaella lignohabitans TaxID=796027 RepID=A0A161HL73_9ASCO|nr:uncharacterized protein AWJ20_4930 [Sugiyamaella lignohabitans]ANB13977.1 hypothetical protein AWJ20_4930 [Sugiyamaella lignohabitans]
MSWADEKKGVEAQLPVPVLEPRVESRETQKKKKKTWSLIFSVVAGVIFVGLFRSIVSSGFWPHFRLRFPHHCHGSDGDESGDLVWKELAKGSNVLHANITLPLDYNDRSAGNVTVALNKIPATHKDGSLGSILLNPGGPGGSGTNLLYRRGADISEIVEGRYDIIGFDPRGINWTSPNFYCGVGDKQISGFNAISNELLSTHGDNVSYGEQLAYGKLQGLACSSDDSGKYISTALVSTDMLHISRALGDEKLNYWGFSYGSILGNTFAQMYPESVGRMIVDGVMDAEDYYAGTWFSNLENTDNVTRTFYEACSASTNCPIEGSPDEIEHLFGDLITKLKFEPATVFDIESGSVGLVTYSGFLSSFFATLYSPVVWNRFANVTLDLLNGNALPFYQMYLAPGPDADSLADSAGYATLCGDASNATYPKTVTSPEALKNLVATLRKSSKWWSDNWLIASGCFGYKQTPVMLWDGPFQKVNASMLLIGNTYDPVTPISAARKMATFYTDSAVIHQSGVGHCSLAQKSSCTAELVRNWFNNGVLPPPNTVCPTDEVPFETAQEATVTDLFIPRFFSV